MRTAIRSLLTRLPSLPVLLPLCVLLACPNNAWAQVFRVGVLAPLSGPYSDYGSSFYLGVRDLIEKINDRGGIHGYNIEITRADSACRAETGIHSTDKLVHDSRIQLLFHISCGGTIGVVSDRLQNLRTSSIHAGAFLPNPEPSYTKIYSAKMGVNFTDWKQVRNDLEDAGFPTIRCQPLDRFGSPTPGVMVCSEFAWRNVILPGDTEVKERISALGIHPQSEQMNSWGYWQGISAAEIFSAVLERSWDVLYSYEPSAFFAAAKGRAFDTVLGTVEFDEFGNQIQTEFVLFSSNWEIYRELLPYVLESGPTVSADLFMRGFEQSGARFAGEDELTCCKKKCKKENGKVKCKKVCTNCMVLRAW